MSSCATEPEPGAQNSARRSAGRNARRRTHACIMPRITHHALHHTRWIPISVSVRDGSDDLLDGLWEWEWEGHSKRPRAKAELRMHMPHLHMHMQHHSNKHLWPALRSGLV